MAAAIEIIPNRLFWVSDSHPPRNQPKSFFIHVDNLQYEPFHNDFGPLNLGMTFKFASHLHQVLADPAYKDYKFYHYTTLDLHKQANAAFLMCAFQVIYLGKSAEAAYRPFAEHSFKPFRDASFGDSSHMCTILHCTRGLQQAIALGWFNPSTFDVHSYEYFDMLENGDMNWIIPDKLLAFSAPAKTQWKPLDAKHYNKLFKKLEIQAVVRLNEKNYEDSDFTHMKVYDLFFTDGSCPSFQLVDKFLAIVKKHGRVAVHCKAGLGRTGTMIACYAIKYHGFNAEDIIGWARICRPGSILGPQQLFLFEFQNRVQGHTRAVSYTPNDCLVANCGEIGQGKRLLKAKNPRFSTRVKARPNQPKRNGSSIKKVI